VICWRHSGTSSGAGPRDPPGSLRVGRGARCIGKVGSLSEASAALRLPLVGSGAERRRALPGHPRSRRRQDGGPLRAQVLGGRLGAPFRPQRVPGGSGDVPILTSEDNIVSQPAKILNFLRKQKYNADYQLSAKQGADTLAYIALLEEKLLPAVLHTFWIENDNYFTVTKPWFASRIPFPLSLILPGRMSKRALNRILLTKGEPPHYHLKEVEAQIYRDAKECLNLLSNRLGTSQFFFGNTPTTLDAYVFGFVAPLYKVHFPKVQLQEHVKQLSNLCRFCDDILSCYFRISLAGFSPAGQDTVDANLQKLTQLVNKESNLIEKMDDNLRQSPQLPPRKLPTLKLTTADEESNSFQPLSP
uniref:Metaxin 3 n=1 Tax=Sarcophilus harrisii TaxID=9305 RepID=A0A7N4V1Y3_SARHA